MEVFSTVIVEISEAIFALLPVMENAGNERHHIHSDDSRQQGCVSERGIEFTVNRKARFLEKNLKDLNASVTVLLENSRDSASTLKLCGGWSDICAVRVWLTHFIQTAESMQTVSDTQPVEASTACEATVTQVEGNTKLPSYSDRPRRSLRNCHKAEQDCRTKAVLLSSSKQIKRKQLQESNAQTKRFRVLSSNISEISAIKGEEMLESYANSNFMDPKANVGDTAAPSPMIMSNDEQFATEHLVTENGESLSTHISDGLTVASTGLRQQLKECVDSNKSERRSSPRELKCDSCDYVTGKQRNLHLHIARTHGDRSYACPTCSHRFAVAKDLNHHMKSHSQQYCCELCGRTLKSKYAVALHVACIHKGLAPRPAKRYLCNLCGKMCRNKTDYTIHRNKEHTGIRPFHCDLCNTSFFSKSNLRAHQQVLFIELQLCINFTLCKVQKRPACSRL